MKWTKSKTQHQQSNQKREELKRSKTNKQKSQVKRFLKQLLLLLHIGGHRIAVSIGDCGTSAVIPRSGFNSQWSLLF